MIINNSNSDLKFRLETKVRHLLAEQESEQHTESEQVLKSNPYRWVSLPEFCFKIVMVSETWFGNFLDLFIWPCDLKIVFKWQWPYLVLKPFCQCGFNCHIDLLENDLMHGHLSNCENVYAYCLEHMILYGNLISWVECCILINLFPDLISQFECWIYASYMMIMMMMMIFDRTRSFLSLPPFLG